MNGNEIGVRDRGDVRQAPDRLFEVVHTAAEAARRISGVTIQLSDLVGIVGRVRYHREIESREDIGDRLEAATQELEAIALQVAAARQSYLADCCGEAPEEEHAS